MPAEQTFAECVSTPFGVFQIEATEAGLSAIRFPKRFIRRPSKTEIPKHAKFHLRAGKIFLTRFYSRVHGSQQRVSIDWHLFRPFEKRVLKTLMKVPAGSIVTYGELACRSGSRGAARAVGNALHRNPLPLVIPCHRVIRSDKSLGGFQSGIRWKRKLLRWEGRDII